MSVKTLSEFYSIDDKIELLLEAKSNAKVEEDDKRLNWEAKRNRYDRIRTLDQSL